MRKTLSPNQWTTQSPYLNVTPTFTTQDGALTAKATGTPCFGRWIGEELPVQAGGYYRFNATANVDNVKNPLECAHVLVSWQDGKDVVIQRDYVQIRSQCPLKFESILPAPDGSIVAVVELAFKWEANGGITWDDIFMEPAPTPAPRKIRVASAYTKLPGGSISANLEAVLAAADMAASVKPDIVSFGETVLTRGVVPYTEGGVLLDGPECAQIGAKARQYNMYIMMGIKILENGLNRNCAVLFGRDGNVAGVYRKVQLPLEEVEAGVIPGDETVVFDTDFGKIGALICWDIAFAELSRDLANKGCEIIFMPSNWNAPLQCATRAADNGVFTVLTTPYFYETPSMICNPLGETLARCKKAKKSGFVYADIDLNRVYTSYYFSVGPCMGEPKGVFAAEFRRNMCYFKPPVVNS